MILAAGFGTRMRPLTDTMPKPMVKIAGRPMIDHAIERLLDFGIEHITINTHYKAEILESHIARHPARDKITLLHEPELLNTGGGIKNALPTLGTAPFIVISGDSFWQDSGEKSALQTLYDGWNPDKMDMRLLLQDIKTMALTTGVGDYHCDDTGCLTRALDQTGHYMWTSIRLCKSDIFNNTPDTPFSFLDILDRTQDAGRLYGCTNPGAWHHISTPDDVARVNQALEVSGA